MTLVITFPKKSTGFKCIIKFAAFIYNIKTYWNNDSIYNSLCNSKTNPEHNKVINHYGCSTLKLISHIGPVDGKKIPAAILLSYDAMIDSPRLSLTQIE